MLSHYGKVWFKSQVNRVLKWKRDVVLASGLSVLNNGTRDGVLLPRVVSFKIKIGLNQFQEVKIDQSKHSVAFMYSLVVLKGKVRQRYFSFFLIWRKCIITYIIGKANSQINLQKNRKFSVKHSCGIGFPLVHLVCVEPNIGCYGNVPSHFST